MSEMSGLTHIMDEDEDLEYLPGGIAWPPWRGSRHRYLIELILLSFGMGIVLGCAISLISLTPVIAGSTITSGTLYGAYTLSCIPAPLAIKYVGPKWGLAIGASMYVVYAIGSRFKGVLAWYIIASAVGGVGSTILWTSQGAYLTTIAEAYALSTGQEKSASLGMFNGIFVAIFQFGIVSCQLVSSFVLPIDEESDGTPSDHVVNILYDIYVILVIFGTCVIFLLPKHPVLFAKRATSDITLSEKLLASIMIIVTDIRMPLMIFSNMAFGFEQGFQNGAFYAQIVEPVLSPSKVGFVSAIIAGTGALVGYPLGKSIDFIGTTPIMLLGFCVHAGGFIWLLAISGSYKDTDDGIWVHEKWAFIAPIAILFGIGNAVWNSCNSALFGKYFHDNKEAGFANLKFWSGLATAMMLLVFNQHCVKNDDHPNCDPTPLVPAIGQIYIVLGTLVAGIIGYLISNRFHLKKTTYDTYSIQ